MTHFVKNEVKSCKVTIYIMSNWKREFNNTELYFEENVEGELEEWMHLADPCANSLKITQHDQIDNNHRHIGSL